MMLKTQTKEIGGSTWSVSQFPTGKGLKLLTALTKLLGPGLLSALGSLRGGKGLLDADVNLEKLQPALLDLAERLDEDYVLNKVKELLSETRKDGVEVVPTFDITFQGEYLTLFKVLGFVLEVNYKSFFGGSGTDAQ